ncbi:MAG: proliferating cell nuclear antigen (pcna) [Candidatus Bathyarchaeota archaeon]|nr:MAG: proliferating cell nuclear antigen (pcna) [Candidatus Bathyarchaeota archaeon]
MRIKIDDARQWKNLMVAVSTLVDEATFKLDQNGIRLRAMDPSHVAMVDFEVPKDAFQEYVCDQPIDICVNMGEMLKLLKSVGSDETLEISTGEEGRQLELIFRGVFIRKFVMPTLEMTEEEAPTPKIDFNTKVKMTSSSLKQTMDDASTVSDNVRLEATPQKITFKAIGNLGSATIEFDKDSEVILSLDVKEESNATFSLNYLSEIVKAGTVASDVVDIEFSTNMPVKLNFGLPEEQRLSYYLAPRIESD